MAIQNPSFETPDAAPGEAAHWTLVTHVAGERIAGFGPEPYRAWEDFERWFVLHRVFTGGDLTRAFFDPKPEGYEDFEEAWANDLFLRELPAGQVVAAVFGGDRDVEDMARGWSNDSYATAWHEITATAAWFTDEPIEAFETAWRSNQTYLRSWSDAIGSAAIFGGGTPAETFGGGWSAATTL
jgi:hypothetical protein